MLDVIALLNEYNECGEMKGDELSTASGTSAGESTGFGCRNLWARGLKWWHGRT